MKTDKYLGVSIGLGVAVGVALGMGLCARKGD
jgi:hypothetical protein